MTLYKYRSTNRCVSLENGFQQNVFWNHEHSWRALLPPMAGSKNFTRAGEQAFQKMDKINAEVFTLTYGSMVQQLLKVNCFFFCRLCLPRCRVICIGARTHACTMDTCVDTHETLLRTCTRGYVVYSHVRCMYMSNVCYLSPSPIYVSIDLFTFGCCGVVHLIFAWCL